MGEFPILTAIMYLLVAISLAITVYYAVVLVWPGLIIMGLVTVAIAFAANEIRKED